MNNNELKHYGVPGMKWGVKNNRYDRDHLEKLHNSKPKLPDDPNINYHRDQIERGKKFYKKIAKQILRGQVTSFVEKADGKITYNSKTSKGVVIRDKDGNRITTDDLHKAEALVRKHYKTYISTGVYY